jgi:Fe-S cluster assembly protein SufA/iron-sulfur cluster assembly protein
MSVATFEPTNAVVTVTAAAETYFAQNLAAEKAKGQEKLIRLSTKESGCTGYAYVLDMVEQGETSDEVLSVSDSVTLAIAEDAVELLRGTEIDMVTEGLNHVIKFNNPNVVAECGCGESFSVA